MVDACIDTTIVVDLLRGYVPAIDWLKQQGSLGITPIVWLEVVDGAQDKHKQREALKVLKQFQIVYPIQQDFDWAMQHSLLFKLSHNTGIMDCLIAAVNQRLQLPLYTNNIKHFAPLLGKLASRPY